MANNVKKKIDYNILISIITFLFTIGMYYQQFLTMREEIENQNKKIVYLENKTREIEIEWNKISIEIKYIALNTEEIKKLIIKHIEANNK